MRNRSSTSRVAGEFIRFYEGKLSSKGYRQFKSALDAPPDRFWTEILLPRTIVSFDGDPIDISAADSDDCDEVVDHLNEQAAVPELVRRPGYVCLSSTKRLEGRSQKLTLSALSNRSFPEGSFPDPRSQVSFFTNYLRFGLEGDETWNHPSQRVMLGPLTTFTVEFDPPREWDENRRLAFLEMQLGWLRRPGNGENSRPIHKVIEWAKEFWDFRGLVATYSGNKSIHFIFVFDSSEAAEKSGGADGLFRDYYGECFDRIAKAFKEMMGVEVNADPAMRNPEQFRRLPNGTHVVTEPDKHLFGVPRGTEVPQITLFEHILKKAPNRSTKRFIDPTEMTRFSRKSSKVTGFGSRTKSRHRPWINDDERLFCNKKLDQLVKKQTGLGGFPKLAGLEIGSRLIARFHANKFDQNPNVLIFEDGNQTVVVGGQQPDRKINIGIPLGALVEKWRRAFRREHPGIDGADLEHEEDITTTVVASNPSASPLHQQAARNQLEAGVVSMSKTFTTILINGPEGIGKTTLIMKLIPELAVAARKKRYGRGLERMDGFRPGEIIARRSAVATASYDQAKDKCAAYNDHHCREATLGLVFRSFNQVYEEALEASFGSSWADKKINTSTAGSDDEQSVLRAIQNRQPDVWARMKKIHAEMLEPLVIADPGEHVVLFMVHDVLHQWTEGGLSRLFSHTAFFDTPVEELWKLHEATALAIAVQDELDKSHFIELEPLETVEWCEELFATGGPWAEDFLHLGDARKSWGAFMNRTPGHVKFEDAIRVYRSGITSENNAGVGSVEAYGVDNKGDTWPMYAKRHDHRYAYRERRWWEGLADQVFLLTTEGLPTELFRLATTGKPGAAIYEGNFPTQDRGRVETHVLPNLKAEDNPETVAQMREYLDALDIHAICNKSDKIEDATSYVKAKGNNELADRNIIQVANFVSPNEGDDGKSEYDELQIINYVFGIRNAIRLRHVDLINQAAGRNLGFRNQGMRHFLVLPRSLWEVIGEEVVNGFRYPLDIIGSSSTRRNKKHNTRRRQLELLARQSEDEEMILEEEAARRTNTLDERLDRATEALELEEL